MTLAGEPNLSRSALRRRRYYGTRSAGCPGLLAFGLRSRPNRSVQSQQFRGDPHSVFHVRSNPTGFGRDEPQHGNHRWQRGGRFGHRNHVSVRDCAGTRRAFGTMQPPRRPTASARWSTTPPMATPLIAISTPSRTARSTTHQPGAWAFPPRAADRGHQRHDDRHDRGADRVDNRVRHHLDGTGYVTPYVLDVNNNNTFDTADTFCKPTSFQIISAGQMEHWARLSADQLPERSGPLVSRWHQHQHRHHLQQLRHQLRSAASQRRQRRRRQRHEFLEKSNLAAAKP